ncbi:galactose-1-phosphate uridylyltransferase [Haliovirga abyssi]|uniref:Galactose-1-phosphate uridylyltransferase n=1 Tax=Haliovirga abyssi TaxID=2996794 RepID=A0AAU9DH47_9FUSO|nr:galactose-1-phosphate uridylyltransferase [Haliovirga abyssi]BDU50812.1 galactose-1-phosphate uridylyltransferase [Haliovirga abyssi]
MSELRKDPVSKRWVIFAPERSKRPSDYRKDKDEEVKVDLEEESGKCPFCEGKEKTSGDELLAYEKIPGRKPNSPGWWVRVLENKYPALQDESEIGKKGVGIYDKMNGVGHHEIIVETPKHHKCISDLEYNEVEKVIWAYRDRYMTLQEDARMKYVLIFKNYGKDAGASLEHSHSQLIATPVVPKRVEEEISGARHYYEFRDRCVFCDIVTQELADKERIVEENDNFIAFVFFAGRFPYETWILPKKHSSNFENITKKEVMNLAVILKNVLKRIKGALGDPAYNFVIHTLPINGEGQHYYHWHIEIMPKLTKVAGFEWGSGFYINPELPEKAAKILRDTNIE